MYGSATSPRDWSDHRGQVLPTTRWNRVADHEATQDEPGSQPVVDGEGDGRTCPSDRCYRKSLDPEASGLKEKTWIGSFFPATDQHVWHLRETCVETGEVKNRGLMAIYVDDVLLTAQREVSLKALEAIGKTWECAPFIEATLEKSVTFCGFEFQANDPADGGGFRLHQKSYETDLLKKWGIEKTAWQLNFKLPTPEEEASMERSGDDALVKPALVPCCGLQQGRDQKSQWEWRQCQGCARKRPQ